MTEYQPKTICWSCGKPVEACICGEDSPQPVTLKPPVETLPLCGASKDVIDGNPYYNKGEMERPCCTCGKKWMTASATEWIHGTCPHCGASGSDGQGDGGHEYQQIIKKSFSAETFAREETKPEKIILEKETIYPSVLSIGGKKDYEIVPLYKKITSLSQYLPLPEDQD